MAVGDTVTIKGKKYTVVGRIKDRKKDNKKKTKSQKEVSRSVPSRKRAQQTTQSNQIDKLIQENLSASERKTLTRSAQERIASLRAGKSRTIIESSDIKEKAKKTAGKRKQTDVSRPERVSRKDVVASDKKTFSAYKTEQLEGKTKRFEDYQQKVEKKIADYEKQIAEYEKKPTEKAFNRLQEERKNIRANIASLKNQERLISNISEAKRSDYEERLKKYEDIEKKKQEFESKYYDRVTKFSDPSSNQSQKPITELKRKKSWYSPFVPDIIENKQFRKDQKELNTAIKDYNKQYNPSRIKIKGAKPYQCFY